MKAITQKKSNYFTIIFAVIILILMNIPAFAFNKERDLTNEQTFKLQNEEKLILVDVRTEQEWKKSGIAKGALTISMQDPSILTQITQLRLNNPDKTIAFICASGMRSEIVRAELEKRGFTNIYSVFGGTTGNGLAGWIQDGLPVVSYPDGVAK